MKKIVIVCTLIMVYHVTQAMEQEEKATITKTVTSQDLEAYIKQATADARTQTYLQQRYGKSKLSQKDLRAEQDLQSCKNPYSPIMKVIQYLLANNYYQ